MKKITYVILFAFLALNCNNDDTNTVNLKKEAIKTNFVEKLNEMNYDIWNENSKIIGDLKVYDDNEYVYIACQTNSNFLISEIGLYLGQYHNIPNHFESEKKSFTYYKDIDNESIDFFHKIKKNQLKTDENGCIFISTHFIVKNIETNQVEKAWSVSNFLPRQIKSTHFLYCIQ